MTTPTREPSTAQEDERSALAAVGHWLREQPACGYSLAATGRSMPLPETAVSLLRLLLQELAEGKAVSIVSYDKLLTTNQAAAYLSVSRPYLIRLLDRGDIPFERIGTHRRIRLADLIEYRRQRDDRANAR
jgi:excisionase family DNA binding protein